MNSPLVSVVMPVYNGAKYVAAAIESALAQTYENLELIIVNDGSPDNSAAVIQPFLADRRVKYIEQPNEGVAGARNTALGLAGGEFIAFIDQDDLWMPDKLERQTAYLSTHPAVALVHGYQAYIDASGMHLENPKDWVAPLSGNCFSELFNRNRIAVLTVLLRKGCLAEVGTFNKSLAGADDYELWLRLARRYRFGFIPEVLACYRIHGDNVSHDRFKMTLRELQSLESVLAADPAALKALDGRMVRRRLFRLHHDAGAWHLWHEQDYSGGRDHFVEALKQNPLHWPSWKLALWCSLTGSQRRNLHWYATRLRNLVFTRRLP
ncbi:MAG: glycosyltransferase [Betaproteobacteria bacterium]|nr:glycosyltransferase [Betaproteobacteria bacterium]